MLSCKSGVFNILVSVCVCTYFSLLISDQKQILHLQRKGPVEIWHLLALTLAPVMILSRLGICESIFSSLLLRKIICIVFTCFVQFLCNFSQKKTAPKMFAISCHTWPKRSHCMRIRISAVPMTHLLQLLNVSIFVVAFSSCTRKSVRYWANYVRV